MLDQNQRALITTYLDLKRQWSIADDALMSGCPRSPVPKFPTPQAAADYYFTLHGNPYTGDPLWGVGDFYLDPRRLQAALENGPESIKGIPIDCDDVAGWYHTAVRQMPGYTSYIVTLIDERLFGSHVICVYQGPSGYGACDTNGHRTLPDLEHQTLCDVWSKIYAGNGYKYIAAVPTPYPF